MATAPWKRDNGGLELEAALCRISRFIGPLSTAKATMNKHDPRVNATTNLRGFNARIGRKRKAIPKHAAPPSRHMMKPRNLLVSTNLEVMEVLHEGNSSPFPSLRRQVSMCKW